ncbi:cation diffusion facilitator family transporter [Ochrobactrum sp. WV_118_8]|uniref:Cation diffusion facilitator family transporter n=1 Tax=Stappia indica TaxID=538381 RepID=A0A857C8P5_9HYPH|nr:MULTISPECIES: cation diffusion facilitator family transporter [Hyphomicrobiales]QGZ35277.1 cation diffusion facilitator family transporter [Stappia indica]WKT92961.1 cation diffusion facilitator family transporter [Brucella anthropi]
MSNPSPTSHDNHAGHNHDDHAGHSHAPAVTNQNERRILISFFMILTFMVVEAIGGIVSGSLALLADAGHMLTDAIALGLAYVAFRLGRKAADGKRTFGYMRFEVIAGLVNALTLFGIVGWIMYEAYERFQQPGEVLAGPMFLVAVAGLLVNLFVLWYLTRGETDHVNVKGAVLHVMGDLLGSVGAIAAAIIIWYTNWTPIDPILSVVVSLLILRSAWALLKNALHILLEGAPDNADANDIAGWVESTVPGVEKVSHVHVWSITSGRTLATLQVKPRDGADILATVRQVAEGLKEKFKIEHPTVGIDWEENGDCSLGRQSVISLHAGHAH